MSAVLHSSMAPVLASLDLFDRNHVAGRDGETVVALINEIHAEVPATLDLYLTPRDPVFVPDAAALEAAVWRETVALRLAPDSLARRTVRFPVPATEGTYYLAAVLTRDGDTPVVSQRVVRSIDAGKTGARLRGRRVVLLGGDAAARAWLADRGCEVLDGAGAGDTGGDVVLVWDAAALSGEERATAGDLRRFAESGGRIVVANQAEWTWTDLADCRIGLPESKHRNPVICSRAHVYDGAAHPALEGIAADWFWRWNGLPGAIVNEAILDCPALEQGRKLLWASRPLYTVLLSVPVGKGEIVFCQLRARHRVGPRAATPDPAAERLLANLLTR
jgi:hypothetical protein